jgi:hypothetical protein
MKRDGISQLLLASNGFHQIDIDNALAHLTGVRTVCPSVVALDAEGHTTAYCHRQDAEAFVGAVDEIVAGDQLARAPIPSGATVGFSSLPRRLAETLLGRFGRPSAYDPAFFVATARKTDDEIEAARQGTRIAEAGLEKLLQIARPGQRECDIATEVNLYMKALGANDSFLMLNAGERLDAVMPSSERPLADGDLMLVELSPSVRGQFVQICRTISIGRAAPQVGDKYALLTAAMHEGIGRVKPGAQLGEVCMAIDDHLSTSGYAQYSRPPYIRRRGHGLASGSMAPGNVEVGNKTVLQPGMVFIVHPNQFLPETGYMMCGEPVLVTDTGHEILSRETARLLVAGDAA